MDWKGFIFYRKLQDFEIGAVVQSAAQSWQGVPAYGGYLVLAGYYILFDYGSLTELIPYQYSIQGGWVLYML